MTEKQNSLKNEGQAPVALKKQNRKVKHTFNSFIG